MKKLDDAAAIHTLKTIAQARLQPAEPELNATPELREALAASFGGSAERPASEGDLARAALDVLSEDPEFAEPIRMMSQQGSAAQTRYGDPFTPIALTTAALLVLQTRIKFKRDSKGKWSIEVEKKATESSALKLLVERFLSLIGK